MFKPFDDILNSNSYSNDTILLKQADFLYFLIKMITIIIIELVHNFQLLTRENKNCTNY